MRSHDSEVSALSFTRDGSRVVSATPNHIIVWNAHTGKEIKRLAELHGDTAHLVFSSGGRRFALCGGNEILLWKSKALK